MNATSPERNLYDVLSARDNWDEISQELSTIYAPSTDPERLKTILELVPKRFSLQAGLYFYPVAFTIFSEDPRRSALTQACRAGEGPELSDSQVANILSRACQKIQPEEL